MSDIASVHQLKPANAQLPVHWYFEQEIFAQETKLLFAAGPNYVGHELMVPKYQCTGNCAFAGFSWRTLAMSDILPPAPR